MSIEAPTTKDARTSARGVRPRLPSWLRGSPIQKSFINNTWFNKNWVNKNWVNKTWVNKTWVKGGFALIAASADLGAIVLAAVAAAALTKAYRLETVTLSTSIGGFAILIAAIFLTATMLRGDYAYEHYFSFKAHFRHFSLAWSAAFPAAITIEFMTKASDDLTRASV